MTNDDLKELFERVKDKSGDAPYLDAWRRCPLFADYVKDWPATPTPNPVKTPVIVP